jgi:hypothetical protein
MGHKKKVIIITEQQKIQEKLKLSGLKRLMEDALRRQGIRKKSKVKRNRYDFQTDHGLRK